MVLIKSDLLGFPLIRLHEKKKKKLTRIRNANGRHNYYFVQPLVTRDWIYDVSKNNKTLHLQSNVTT